MAVIKLVPFPLEPFEPGGRSLDDVRASLVPAAQGGAAGLIPLVDVYEDGPDLVVEAPLPGMDPKDIQLSVDHETLSIKAVSERRTEVDEKNYYRQEVRHGLLFRRIPLPSPVQDGAAQASYENGMLTVRLPKRLAGPEASNPSASH